jgi:hypothetical protein
VDRFYNDAQVLCVGRMTTLAQWCVRTRTICQSAQTLDPCSLVASLEVAQSVLVSMASWLLVLQLAICTIVVSPRRDVSFDAPAATCNERQHTPTRSDGLPSERDTTGLVLLSFVQIADRV